MVLSYLSIPFTWPIVFMILCDISKVNIFTTIATVAKVLNNSAHLGQWDPQYLVPSPCLAICLGVTAGGHRNSNYWYVDPLASVS